MNDREPPGIPHKKSRAGLYVAGAIILAAAVMGIASLVSTGASSAPGSGSARHYCEQAVREQLTAPDTASFQGAATDHNGKWDVSGIVMSDNAFGAAATAAYNCTVTFDGDTPTTTLNYLDG